eukprot:1333165-Pyramimonas_sp.AAC.2
MYDPEASKLAAVSQIQGWWFSKCGSRLNAAHIRFKHLQELHRVRAGGFQNVVLALAPRKIALNIRKSFTD